jgi:hypothetical protein
MTIEDLNPVSAQVPRKKKVRTNPGFSETPGMEIPVPIKLDKWHSINTPPARRKKANPTNVTQVVFVDFSIPVLPPVNMDQWFNISPPPPRKKSFVRPSVFATTQIAAINPVNGNYFDSGVVSLEIIIEADESQTYRDSGVTGLTVTIINVEDFQLEDIGVTSFTVKYPEVGVEVFNSGVPGFVSANVIINGLNESNFIQGIITVTREDNTAARFKLSLEEDPDVLIPRKPVEFINKIVSISFAAADMDGVVSDYIPIFIGIIKGASFNADMETLNLRGYDYSGIHQTPGEYISENITSVLTGSIGAGSSGTLSTGHSPIWGVEFVGSNAVTDGTDYFVDTKDGNIIIPISSRILQFPGHFTYSYADPFGSMKEIIQAVVSQKSWNLQEDNMVIANYTNAVAHPVLSLSDESVIDTCRKFLELSGAKIEGNLFPDLRVYSEVENWINPASTWVVDEDVIFENSFVFDIDFDNLLNEQTVRSVQKVNADIVIGAGESIAEFSANRQRTDPRTVQTSVVWWSQFDLTIPYVVAEHRVNKQNLNSISFSSSGQFHAALIPFATYEKAITGASWNFFTDGDDFVIQLKHNIITLEGGGIQYWTIPAFEYSLTVLGSKINYSGGSPEDVRVVTAQRPISGITETLKGDVYENPYIETDGHCANICNAVLLEKGNPYSAQFQIPLFEGKSAQIGGRVDINRDGNAIFSGIVKKLRYRINLENGQNEILVLARGIGKGM